MSADRIEREILIAAPMERVWPLVAEPGWWVTDETNHTGTVAAAGESIVVKHAEHGDFPVRVEKVEPPTYVAFRWVSAFPGEELREDNSTLVEFFLTTVDDKTQVRIVESGLATLAGSEELRSSVMKDHSAGWIECAEAIKARAEKTPA